VTEPSGPVVSMVELRVDAADSSILLDEAVAVLTAEARDQAGFIAGEVLGSIDRTSIKIVTEWSDRHAWGQSRYDRRVGLMLEHCNTKATRIEFEVYVRHGAVIAIGSTSGEDYATAHRE
jgi:hypothetical protein